MRVARIPPNTLSARLRTLDEAGVVKRALVEERPPHAEYSMTDAGHELWLPLRTIGIGGTHVQTQAKRVQVGCGGEARVKLECEGRGQELQDADTTMQRR